MNRPVLRVSVVGTILIYVVLLSALAAAGVLIYFVGAKAGAMPVSIVLAAVIVAAGMFRVAAAIEKDAAAGDYDSGYYDDEDDDDDEDEDEDEDVGEDESHEPPNVHFRPPSGRPKK